jgi:hypothetical protein
MMGQSEGETFRAILEGLADQGWQSEAGESFVAFMGEVLERTGASVRARVGVAGVMASPEDPTTEAVLIVAGTGVPLGERVEQLLSLENPLGYVVAGVSKNLSRAVLSSEMGMESRYVSSGTRAVEHLEGLVEDDTRDRLECTAVWRTAESEPSRWARSVCGTFGAVLTQRFRVGAGAVTTALEIAGTGALDGERGAGQTSATARRRIKQFVDGCEEQGRGRLDRVQARAMAALIFGSERHPEWSLLQECGAAVDEHRPVRVSSWHSRHARTAAAAGGRPTAPQGRQPALFTDVSQIGAARAARKVS